MAMSENVFSDTYLNVRGIWKLVNIVKSLLPKCFRSSSLVYSTQVWRYVLINHRYCQQSWEVSEEGGGMLGSHLWMTDSSEKLHSHFDESCVCINKSHRHRLDLVWIWPTFTDLCEGLQIYRNILEMVTHVHSMDARLLSLLPGWQC